MERTDEEIMMDYQSGRDREGIQMIFSRYKTRIFNFSLRILGNRADAEDVTGDVFLALFSQKYTYDPKAKFSTWLYTVARNGCISQIRKRKNLVSVWFSSRGSSSAKEWEFEDPTELAGLKLQEKEAADHVRAAIGKLPYEQREALVLREYHDLSYDEISDILRCSLEKVKILIFRGREQLRKELSSFIREDDR